LAVHTPSRILSADAVILTVPLGCLQRSTINFEPPLPTRVISAIKNLGFGNLEKLFLKFDEAWWNDPFSTKEPPEIFTFLPPSTLPPACPRRLLTMFSLANLPINAQPVLAIYLAADWTTFIASQSHESIASVFQNHYLPCLPNYHRNCTIREVFCTQWTTDPWTYGSYTHIPVGSQDGIEDLRILGEKIVGLENGVGGLWLAGEHAGTADVGTVNGAMTSGKLAAVEILKAFGETVEQDTE
jgi:monoamine oxidase